MTEKFTEKFLNEPSRVTVPDEDVDTGYCINCQIDDAWTLKLALLGKVRTTPIDCECGCKVAIFDMDIEKYIVYETAEVRAR